MSSKRFLSRGFEAWHPKTLYIRVWVVRCVDCNQGKRASMNRIVFSETSTLFWQNELLCLVLKTEKPMSHSTLGSEDLDNRATHGAPSFLRPAIVKLLCFIFHEVGTFSPLLFALYGIRLTDFLANSDPLPILHKWWREKEIYRCTTEV